MANPEISVIVPVYNVEHYLAECLDSLRSQSISDIEIICVNDGSSDGSEKVVREYIKKDSRIRLINQKNQGVSSARNKGIKEAKGKYIYFMDADDSITLNYLEGLYDAALEYSCDIVANENILYYHAEDEENNRLKLPRFHEFIKISPRTFFRNPGRVVCWNKLFSADFLCRCGLSFPRLAKAEDVCFYKAAIVRADKMAFSEAGYYFYRQHEGSLMEQLRKGNGAEDNLQAFFLIFNDYQKLGCLQEYFPPISLLKNYMRYSVDKRKAWKIMRKQLKDRKVWREARRWADRRFLWAVCFLPYHFFTCRDLFYCIKTNLKKFF